MDTTKEMPRMLTLAELSAVLRLNEKTIRLWIAKGNTRGVYRAGDGRGSDYRFVLSEVLEGMRVR